MLAAAAVCDVQKYGSVGVIVIGSFTSWLQSGSNVEHLMVSEAAVSSDHSALASTWFWFESADAQPEADAPAPNTPLRPGTSATLARPGVVLSCECAQRLWVCFL